jgi:putative transcriptional regulator
MIRDSFVRWNRPHQNQIDLVAEFQMVLRNAKMLAGVELSVRGELARGKGRILEKFAAKLGVTYPTINRWENRRAKPSPLALKQIEDLLRGLGERGKNLLQEFFSEVES